jgi:hypothetical protein
MRRGAVVAWTVVIAVALLAVGFVSHLTQVVEASYSCPVIEGEEGTLAYSFSGPSTCTYERSTATFGPEVVEADPEGIDWLDPPISAAVFGVGALVVIGGATWFLLRQRRRWRLEDAAPRPEAMS